jgi:hypothetical protein
MGGYLVDEDLPALSRGAQTSREIGDISDGRVGCASAKADVS